MNKRSLPSPRSAPVGDPIPKVQGRRARLPVLLLGACLVLALTTPRVVAQAQRSASPFTDEELEQVVSEIRATYEEANAALETLPRDRFDRAPALEASDYDPEAIVAWVAGQTWWVPYRGVLRGADGVLMDLRGNSLDRSLLLAALLEDAGYDTRLVNGQLSRSTAETLLRRAQADLVPPGPDDATPRSRVAAAIDRAIRQAEALHALASLPDRAWIDDLVPVAADHWWVEFDGDAGWQVADPLLTGDLESERPTDVRRVSADRLPDELFHEVSVRVVIERWLEGEVVEEVPLDYSVRTSTSPSQAMELVFVPFGFRAAPEDADAATETLAVADGAEAWLPLLRVGTERVRQQGFGRDGHLQRNPAKPALVREAERAAGALGAIGRDTPVPESILSGGWIEYELRVPGRESRVVRRELFDLIGPERRGRGDLAGLTPERESIRDRGLALLGKTGILVQSTAVPEIAFDRAELELWARQGPLIAAVARLMHDPKAEEPLRRLQREPLIPLDLLALALTRDETSRFRAATYLRSANVFTTHYLLAVDGELRTDSVIDLVANEVGVVPPAGVAPSRVRLEQGVLDTVLEAAMDPAASGSGNTSELFARRADLDVDWRVMHDAGTHHGLPAEALARISRALAAGRLVVAPTSVPEGSEAAWWEIDPASGTTLGIGPRGWGQEGAEEAETEILVTAGTEQGGSALGRSQMCKLTQAASWAVDVYDFQAADRALHARRMREKERIKRVKEMLWRSKNLRSKQKLELMEKIAKSC